MQVYLGNTPLDYRGIQLGDVNIQNVIQQKPIELGDYYGGGVVFYVVPNAQTGLIVSISDIAGNTSWGCGGVLISGLSLGYGSGQSNTTQIITECTQAGIAAKLCSDYSNDGYSDWYLPSYDELQLLYTNRSYVPGLSGQFYWSSNQAVGFNSKEYYAASINMVSGNTRDSYKTGLPGEEDYVRAVRSF